MEKVEKIRVPGFLSAEGEMGDRIRNFDWALTSIGEPEQWSESLRSALSLILANRFPMILWWGKDYIQFYNDPYIPIPGLKHPKKVLGQPACECWSEIWSVIGPLIDTPFNSGPATWMDDILLKVNRNNFIEETHFTIAYSPVPDTTAPKGIGGVLATVNEITESVIGKRQMETLKELGKNISATLSESEVYIKSAESFGGNLFDIPFALLHKIDADGRRATLVATSGIEINHPELLAQIDLENPDARSKNVATAVLENRTVVAASENEWMNLPKGEWDIAPQYFAYVPIKVVNKKFPVAILTIALNPYRKFDDGYRNFVRLLADQVSLGVNNAIAYEEERRRAEALQELDKSKTIFFSNISHEFRTPLTLMLGSIEEALSDPDTIPLNKERLTVTHRNAMRLLKLVNTLLDFSRIESGRQMANYTLTNIALVTRNLASNFQSVTEKAGLKLIVNAESFVQPVYLDNQMWEKIVFNLLSNAFKYTLKGSITVNLFSDNSHAILEVADTGVGIPEKDLPRMFERFHRVENATGRTYEGTGIGLSLIKELIHQHGGTIGVRSKHGEGSTFTVSIPFGKDHLPDTQISDKPLELEDIISEAFIEEARSLLANTEPSPIVNNKEGDRATVLVVDDNADMRQHIQFILQRQFNVITAANGMEALHRINAERPSLVLSDIMMPIMDGIQLLKEIKGNKETAAIPVILLTARAGEESKIAGYETGADDYMVKPFSANELLSRIRAQVDIAGKRREIEYRLEQLVSKAEESEMEVRRLFEQAPVAIAIYNGPEFVVDFANKHMLEFYGKTREEIIGNKIFDVFPEVAGHGVRALHENVFRSGNPFKVYAQKHEYYKNGELYTGYFDIDFEPMKEIDGTVSGLIITGHEVTTQVLAKQKIEESEKRFRTMANEAPLLVWVTDEKLQTTFLNKTGFTYFNLDENIQMSELSWKKYIHPDDLDNVLATMKEAAENQRAYTLEMRLRNGATDEYRWFLDKGVARFENGRLVGFIGTTLDIHDRKETENLVKQSEKGLQQLSAVLEEKVRDRTRELQKKNIELEQVIQELTERELKDEKKDEFISIASHELKTPLTSAKGYVQLMSVIAAGKGHNELMPLLLKSNLSLDRLSKLIDDLLDVTKIQHGKLQINFSDFDFNELIRESVEFIELTSRNRKLSVKGAAGQQIICGDKERLRHVCLNLLSNAVKYSPEESTIAIKIKRDKDELKVEVSDKGIGIAKDDLPHVFERFFRARNLGANYQGLGIGLFLAAEIIHSHHGEIWVESEEGKGSNFYFTIPVKNN